MDILGSSQNQHIKALRSLYTKKGRDALGCYPVEGVNIVKDIPPRQRVSAYYFAADRYDELRYVIRDDTADVFVVQPDLLARVVETVEPAGVVAVLPIPPDTDDWHTEPRLLVLDDVRDPGNVGTLLRTALAAGFGDILLLGGADPYNPKVVRASMGGIYRAAVHRTDAATYAEVLRRHPRATYALAMDGTDVFALRPTLPYAVVVGNEAHGIGAPMRALADGVLAIPMQGGLESLNAAVAGAVAMYVLIHNEI